MRRICFFFLLFFLHTLVSFAGDFKIVELMPNTSDDKNLEYITIKNISHSSQSLSDFILSDTAGKQYIFGEEILEPGERKDFYRPLTKIILNNSDEEIFLHDPESNLVDSVKYESSVKSYFLSYPEEEIKEVHEKIISAEWLISGELFFSDEGEVTNESGDGEGVPEIKSSDTTKISELSAPEIIMQLQRPSYISESENLGIFICDTQKEECKVNFDLRGSFSDVFPEKNYICHIDFGFGVVTGEEQKCNPNTMVFPEGEHKVVIHIFHEDDRNIFSEKILFVHMMQKNETEGVKQDEVENTGEKSLEKNNKIQILTPNIIVQSGLTGGGKYFYCMKVECSINLNYKKKHPDERCLWRFRGGIQSSVSTHTRCNPGYVKFPEGVFELSLKVYQKDDDTNYALKKFYVYNQDVGDKNLQEKPELVWKRQDDSLGSGEIQQQKINTNYSVEIELQGKISKEKTFSGGVLTCNGVEKCYVNFQGIITGEEEGGEYIWKLDDALFSQSLNPKGIWVEGEGEHHVTLQVGDISKSFIVKIHSKKIHAHQDENIKYTMSEGDTIKFTQNFLVLKYDGLRISGSAPAGSKIEIYTDGEKIIEGFVDEKGKYRLVGKNFLAKEYVFDTKIILPSGEEKILEKSGIFYLEADKRSYWFVSKVKKASSKKEKTIKNPALIMQSGIPPLDDMMNEKDLHPLVQIFLIILICICALIGTLHLFFLQRGTRPISLLDIYLLSYMTKQKICLIVK